MSDPLWSQSWRGLALALLLTSPAAAQVDRPPGSSYYQLAQADDVPSTSTSTTTSTLTPQPSQPNDDDISVATQPTAGGAPGLGVDARGNPVIDPTANVIALSRAATQRQDDLREASERFILAQIQSLNQLVQIRSENAALLRAAETRRIDDLINLRADLEAKLQEKESERIDAIRTVDANAVQNATESAAERASVLAQNVDSSAEALRSLVASTEQSVAAAAEQSNTALTTALERINGALSERISALEQVQYVGQGRQALSDPALIEMQESINRLIAREASTTGQTEGSSNTVAYVFSGISGFLALLSIGALLWQMTQRPPHQPDVEKNGRSRA